MESPRIDWIFFDAAGTLFRLRESVGAGYSRIAAEYGIPLDPDATEAAFRAQWNARPAPNPGSPFPEDGALWWRDLAFGILDSLGLPEIRPEQRDGWFQALYRYYAEPDPWLPYPETMKVLNFLSRNTPCHLGVLSNFDRRLYGILEGLGLRAFFERVIVSSEVGFSKPHPAIFEAAWRGVAASPGHCLHAGNEPEADWQGAARAGFQVHRVRRPETGLQALTEIFPGPPFLS